MKEHPSCSCKRTGCERHGNCKACKEHHHSLAKLNRTDCERNAMKKRAGKKIEK